MCLTLPFFAAQQSLPRTFAQVLIDDSTGNQTGPESRVESSSRGNREPSPDVSLLNVYMDSIFAEQNRLDVIITSRDIFRGFRGMNTNQALDDFDYGFPFYDAAANRYQIPWYLLWIIHEYETNDSREKYPERGGFVGAMQRNPAIYPDEIARQAAAGYEFLNLLPQRYSKSDGDRTNDYEEIFFAAWKIHTDSNDLQKEEGLSDEAAILEAQYRYCAAWSARERINRYWLIKNQLGE